MHKKHLTSLLSAFIILFFVQASYSQNDTILKRKAPQQGKIFEDDASNVNDYLLAIERASAVLESAYTDAEFGPDIYRLMGEMDQAKGKLKLILKNIKTSSPNVRNQQMYRTMLLEMQDELESRNTIINAENEKLDKIKDRVTSLRKDTIFIALIKDTVARKKFRRELLGLKTKYMQADSLMSSNINLITVKKRQVVKSKMRISSALVTVEKRLEKSGISIMGNEYPYLWQTETAVKKKELSDNIKDKFQVERGVVSYYFSYSLGGLITLTFFMALLGYYIFRNIRYLKSNNHFERLPLFGFKYLNSDVVLPILVITMNIAVVTNLYAPAMFIELIQLLLLIVLSLQFKNDWSKKSMRNWLMLLGLFIALCFLDLFVKISFVERCIFIAINVAAIRYGMVQLKSIQDQLYIKSFFKWARIIFITLNGLAIIFNLFGRVSISHTLSLTAIIALTQIIALSVLLKIILEIILLQIYTTRIKRGIEEIFDHESLSDNLKKPFVLIITYMWIVVIASNLNIWESLHNGISALLKHPNSIGSVTFTVGGVLLFFVIVWLAHFLQKYVAYFFGEIDNENEENINKRQHSRLLVARLVVLIGGYLLAIAASGMPMDKLSIVLGALGVGVGLGLQSIVNNFVSGIILIFDRPIQVGDIIEVSSQSGRVKSMGLRTTKINAPNGAEIIIPNGNILSQNITNWTYTDNLKLVEINVGVSGETSTENIDAIVNKALATVALVDENKPVQIYYSSMAYGNYKLLIKFWCSIYRTEEAMSTAKQALYLNFKASGLTFTT